MSSSSDDDAPGVLNRFLRRAAFAAPAPPPAVVAPAVAPAGPAVAPAVAAEAPPEVALAGPAFAPAAVAPAPAPAAKRPRSAAQRVQLANARTSRQRVIGHRLEADGINLAMAAKRVLVKSRRGSRSTGADVQVKTTRRRRRKLKKRVRKDFAGKRIVGKNARLTSAEDLSIAFSRSLRSKDVAIQSKTSETTVRDTKMSSAEAYLESLVAVLVALRDKCDIKRPVFAGGSLKWDESLVSLSTPVFAELFSQLSSKKLGWSILLAKRHVVVGFEDGSLTELEVWIPPTPMFETNSSALHDGLIDAPGFATTIKDLIGEIISKAELGSVLHGNDGASSNTKFNGHVLGRVSEDNLAAAIHCGNHVNKLIEVCMTALAFQDICSKMYACHTLLRTGSFMLRFVASVTKWLLQPNVLVVLRGRPPPEVTLSMEFRWYVIYTYILDVSILEFYINMYIYMCFIRYVLVVFYVCVNYLLCMKKIEGAQIFNILKIRLRTQRN